MGEGGKDKQPEQKSQPDKQEKAKPEPSLENDDMFEEFAGEADVKLNEVKELPLWEADWEDEDVGDDFSRQLKAELDRVSKS